MLYPIDVVHYNSSWTALVWSLRPNICVIRLIYEPVAKKRSYTTKPFVRLDTRELEDDIASLEQRF